MSQALSYPAKYTKTAPASSNFLYRLGGSAALLQLACTLAIIIAAVVLGARPTTVEEYYSLYQGDRLEAFLQDDFLSLIMIAGPFYLAWFPMLARDLLCLGRANRDTAITAQA
jgi:hypothetical protein